MRVLNLLLLLLLTIYPIHAQVGTYSETVGVEEIQADFDLLWVALNPYNPGLYLHRSEQELLEIRNNLKSSIT